MSSILEALRKEHATRNDGGRFTASLTEVWRSGDNEVSSSVHVSTADYSPNASMLGGLAVSILLGGLLGAGFARFVRGGTALPLVGAERGHESVVTQQTLSHATVNDARISARTRLPSATTSMGERHQTPHRERIQAMQGADSGQRTTPVLLPVIASVTLVARQPPGTIVPASVDKPTLTPAVLDGGASVQVFDDQRVTVTGEATSVRSLVAEICRQAGIDLRTYTAPDHRYAGRVQGEPLAEAFRRILRSESYLVGLRLDPYSRKTRMAWLQVVSSQAAGHAQPVVAPENTAPEAVGVASAKRMLPP